ncbi:HAD family hydrolase [Halosolutus amylolyticus]|uniref:HAD family hydrolase n=1 Tax=Halosolutus amylolyticus TaxID=2932267 RepID=A0ABD5PM81_9EURY|nr:HAD-IA family hydrolase [Halosolutus amylolyticus]
MTDYDAVVYDLDGTLVHLDVDWEAVEREVRGVYHAADLEPPGNGLWDMLEAASELDVADDVEAAIAEYERAGARRSRRLPRADELPDRETQIGVCSLNCEAACRIALDEHDLTDGVDVVVGRDTVSNQKPHPEPLLKAVAELDVAPDRTLFIGDSATDERTADRAGVAFEYVGDGPSGV